MNRILIVCIVFLFIAVSFALIDSTSILTPGYENVLLAKVDGKEVREFDVFGIPSVSKIRDKMTKSKRAGKIQDYILDLIFQSEGNIPEITNSEDYKKAYDQLLMKISVDRLREDIISERFLSKQQIKSFYESNKDKYPEGMKQIDKIKVGLKKAKDKEINHLIKQVLDSLKRVRGVIYNEDLLKSISQIKIKEPVKYADSLLSIGAKKELITYKDKKNTVGHLAKIVKQLKPYHMENLKRVNVLKSLVDGKILNDLLVEVAKEKGYTTDKRVVADTVDKMKYFVSSEYKKRLFSTDNLKPTKDELIDYYIEHKDDAELKTKKKMWTYEIFKSYDNHDSIESNDQIKVAIELENIRQKILAGESFEKYAKFYARPNTRDGELGYIYRSDYAKIGETADTLKVNEISDLVIQQKAISIVKITEIKEPQLYKFDYVEEIVKNRVIEEKRDKLKGEIKRKLFKKYKVELLNAQ